MQVLPTDPSPTTSNFIVIGSAIIYKYKINTIYIKFTNDSN